MLSLDIRPPLHANNMYCIQQFTAALSLLLIVLSDVVAEGARSCDDVTIGHMEVGLAELAPVAC